MNDLSFTGTLNGKKLLFRSFDETGEIQVTDVSKEISLIIKYSEIKWINNPVSPIIKCTNDTGEHFRHISGTDVSLDYPYVFLVMSFRLLEKYYLQVLECIERFM